jgi:hypothetical protein
MDGWMDERMNNRKAKAVNIINKSLTERAKYSM